MQSQLADIEILIILMDTGTIQVMENGISLHQLQILVSTLGEILPIRSFQKSYTFFVKIAFGIML
ncbi:hypothetical protein DNK01_15870 [Stutzerimonas kirkiae]|nr:hypothetical protein DNK01_15870 [Stutzerimonas kirkiae]